jgi:hypothetical protein
MKLKMWINEGVAGITGFFVAGYMFDTWHMRDEWASVVLFIVVASGIAMVVDGASNGLVRLATSLLMELGETSNRLESKIKHLESSIDELTRRLERGGGSEAASAMGTD